MFKQRKSHTGYGSRALVAVAALVVGCGGSNVIGPENQLEANSAADNFQFQVSNLDNVSQNLSYTWENTGTQAVVDISQAISAGSAMLTVTDADGAVMYQDDVRADNDGDTSVGTAGVWRVELQLEGVTGTFNFRVQRKT
jgi:hypothetical protein